MFWLPGRCRTRALGRPARCLHLPAWRRVRPAGRRLLAALAARTQPGCTRPLGFRELEALPSVLRDSRSALVLVKTDQGNLARLLVSPGFRKRPATRGHSSRSCSWSGLRSSTAAHPASRLREEGT